MPRDKSELSGNNDIRKRIEDLKRLESETAEAAKTSKRVYERQDAKALYDKLRVERLKLETWLALHGTSPP